MLNFFQTPTSETESIELSLQKPCFISDMHLNVYQEKDLNAFAYFLKTYAERFQELVILGDCFDYWVGDDSLPLATSFVSLINNFSKTHDVFIMHGNRDFMLGQRFAKACGARLIADPCVANIDGKKYLLSHGDVWCTKDQEYQKVRARVRSSWWQWLMLRYPLKKRLLIANNARLKSQKEKTQKSQLIMDVDNDSILACVTDDTVGILHGHTHQPGCYTINDHMNRWVIPDWRHCENNSVQAGFIMFENNTPIIKWCQIPCAE